MTRRADIKELSNDQLLQRVRSLVSRTNRSLAELLWYLAEVDARGLYREQACSSMFVYCTDRLGFSESVAYKRITAARLARKFPAILRRIASGDVHLTGIKVLATVLTAENHEWVLEQAAGKKTREVGVLAASLAPKPDVPALIRKLPKRGREPAVRQRSVGDLAPTVSGKSQKGECCQEAGGQRSSRAGAPSAVLPAAPVRRDRGIITPLREDRFKVQFTASAKLREKFQRAEDLLGPAHRGGVAAGDMAVVVERALDALIERLEKKRFAKTERAQRKPRARKPGTRYIPQEVRRAVAERDGDRCTFVDKAGRRCKERSALEFHHRHAFARGGEATRENISLLCHAHNALEAERDFGAEHMERSRRVKDATVSGGVDAQASGGRLLDALPSPTLRVRDGSSEANWRWGDSQRLASVAPLGGVLRGGQPTPSAGAGG